MSVAAVLRGKPDRLIGLDETRSLAEAAQLLIVRNTAGDMIGILSERDIVRAISKDGAAAIERPVSSIMTRDVICVTAEDDVSEVMSLMTAKRFRHLPVKRDEKLVGMISIGDVVKQRVEEAEGEAQQLRQYIAS
jgi:CBS domain-containing protein